MVAGLLVIDAGAAWARDGHAHKIMGTVTAREATRLEVKTPGGEVLSIAITDKTTVTRNKRKVGSRTSRPDAASWSTSATAKTH